MCNCFISLTTTRSVKIPAVPPKLCSSPIESGKSNFNFELLSYLEFSNYFRTSDKNVCAAFCAPT